MRAFLILTLKAPNRCRFTRSSRDIASFTSDRNALSTADTLRLETWVLDATSFTSDSLFMVLRLY